MNEPPPSVYGDMSGTMQGCARGCRSGVARDKCDGVARRFCLLNVIIMPDLLGPAPNRQYGSTMLARDSVARVPSQSVPVGAERGTCSLRRVGPWIALPSSCRHFPACMQHSKWPESVCMHFEVCEPHISCLLNSGKLYFYHIA
jgi:hypothetical protein